MWPNISSWQKLNQVQFINPLRSMFKTAKPMDTPNLSAETTALPLPAALRRATDRGATVVESDPDGIITHVNDKFCRISGYCREELLGQELFVLSSTCHPQDFLDELWVSIAQGNTWNGEISSRAKDGNLFWQNISITPISGVDGKPAKFLMVGHDISTRKLIGGILWQQAQMIDQSHDAIFSMDFNGTVLSWNRGAEQLFGYSREEAFGKPILFTCHGLECGNFWVKTLQVLKVKETDTLEATLCRKSGGRFDAHLSLSLLKDSEGVGIGVIGYAIDITARKQADELLRESYEELRAIFEGSNDAIMLVSEKGFFDCNTRALEMFGIGSKQELISCHPSDISPPFQPDGRDSLSAVIENNRIAFENGVNRFEWICRRRSGEDFPVDVLLSTFDYGGKRALQATVRDITERKRAEQELIESHHQLRKLSVFLQTVREEERKRIARELHDELGQTMTALRFDLNWISGNLNTQESSINDKILAMNAMVSQTVDSIRRISDDLRPAMLDDLGLVAAIENHAAKFAERTNIACDIFMSQPDFDLDDLIATALFRIAQEALTNVARHSAANQVTIRLHESEDQVLLIVQDNGCGFSLGQDVDKKTYGLLGMRERVKMLGGILDIFTEPMAGVRVEASIPKCVKKDAQ